MKADYKSLVVISLVAASLLATSHAQAQSLEWSYEQYDPSPVDRAPRTQGHSLAEVNAAEKQKEELATLSKLARRDAILSASDVSKSSAQKVIRPDIIDPNPGVSSNGRRSPNAYGAITSPDQRNPLLNTLDGDIREMMRELSAEKAKLSRILSSRGHSQEEALAQVKVVNEKYSNINEGRVKRALEQRKRKYLQQHALQQQSGARRQQRQSTGQPRSSTTTQSNPYGAEDSFSSGQ